MLSKNKEKLIRSLHKAKGRKKAGLFFLEGETLAGELLHRLDVQDVFCTAEWSGQNESLLRSFSGNLHLIDDVEMKRISALVTPSEVLFTAKIPSPAPVDFSRKGLTALYLDGIRDPGNMGTILRIADWFGIGNVVASPDCVDFYNPKVVQASMGAVGTVALHVAALEALAQKAKNVEWWATAMTGENVFEVSLPESPVILMIGNEGQGLRPEAFRHATRHVHIPGAPGCHAESLNAAVATGILCAALTRKAV